MAGLYVAGTGSFALEVIEYARASGQQVVGLLELVDPSRVGGTVHGLRVVAPDAGSGEAVVGLGGDRLELWSLLAEHGWQEATVVHPAAHVSPSARLGEGCVVGPRAVADADFHGIEMAADIGGVDVAERHVEP